MIQGEPIPNESLRRAMDAFAEKQKQAAELEYIAVDFWRYVWDLLFKKQRHALIGEIRVWKINDYEWIAARSLNEAENWYLLYTGEEWGDVIDDPQECLLSETMRRERGRHEDWIEVTFAEQISYLAKQGYRFPMVIASTEY